MKNIQVTDEQYEILKRMSEDMGKQDPRATRLPLFCVAEYKKVPMPEDCGKMQIINEEGDCIIDENDNIIKWWKENKENILDSYGIIEEEYNKIKIEDNILAEDDIIGLLEDKGFRKVYYEIERKFPHGQVYFTEEGANRHIKANNYHYNEPHTYVVSAWRNIEMETLLDVVHNICNEGGAHR